MSGIGGVGSPAPSSLKSGAARPILGSEVEDPRGPLRADRSDREARLRQATKEFEAVFIQEMLKAMRSTVPEGGLVDAGQSEDMFTALLDEHVARAAGERSQRGLADALYRQFVGRLGS